MAGIKGSKVFRYTDEMRSRAKEIFKERVPEKDSKRPFGLWSDLSRKMSEEFPELKEVPDMTLRSWIRNVCLYDKVSISERSKQNTNLHTLAAVLGTTGRKASDTHKGLAAAFADGFHHQDERIPATFVLSLICRLKGSNFTCCQWHPRIPITRLFSHYMQGLSHYISHYIFSELPGFPWDEPGPLESRKSHCRNGSGTF